MYDEILETHITKRKRKIRDCKQDSNKRGEEEGGRDTVPQDRGPRGRKEGEEEAGRERALPPQTELWSQHNPVSESQLHTHSFKERLREKSTVGSDRNRGRVNTVRLRVEVEMKVVVNQFKCASVQCVCVCVADIPQDKAGPGPGDPALPSGPLDLASPLLLCHPGCEDDSRTYRSI